MKLKIPKKLISNKQILGLFGNSLIAGSTRRTKQILASVAVCLSTSFFSCNTDSGIPGLVNVEERVIKFSREGTLKLGPSDPQFAYTQDEIQFNMEGHTINIILDKVSLDLSGRAIAKIKPDGVNSAVIELREEGFFSIYLLGPNHRSVTVGSSGGDIVFYIPKGTLNGADDGAVFENRWDDQTGFKIDAFKPVSEFKIAKR